MEKRLTIRRILEAVRISDSQVDLVGKILDLEEDTTRVHSVELLHGTVGYNGLWARVYLLRQFKDLTEISNYLHSRGLNPPYISQTRDEESFIFNQEGVKVDFFKPDFYPERIREE